MYFTPFSSVSIAQATFEQVNVSCVCVCLCVCVCVCLRVNNDVIRLGVKVEQGLPCVRHYIPRSSGEPL